VASDVIYSVTEVRKTHVPGHIEVRIKRAIEFSESGGLPGFNVVVIERATSRET
jgi:hypothetical protein